MSLINDALRRASQAEKNRPLQTPRPMSMEPVAVEQKRATNRLLFGTIIILLFLAITIFSVIWQMARKSTEPQEVITIPVVRKAAAVNPPEVKPAPETAPAVPKAAAAAPPTSPVTPVVSSSPPPAPIPPAPWPVDLKLSAIFYSKTSPQVVINGNIYGVGDEIQGIVVTKIERNQATVEWKGQTKVLFVGG